MKLPSSEALKHLSPADYLKYIASKEAVSTLILASVVGTAGAAEAQDGGGGAANLVEPVVVAAVPLEQEGRVFPEGMPEFHFAVIVNDDRVMLRNGPSVESDAVAGIAGGIMSGDILYIKDSQNVVRTEEKNLADPGADSFLEVVAIERDGNITFITAPTYAYNIDKDALHRQNLPKTALNLAGILPPNPAETPAPSGTGTESEQPEAVPAQLAPTGDASSPDNDGDAEAPGLAETSPADGILDRPLSKWDTQSGASLGISDEMAAIESSLEAITGKNILHADWIEKEYPGFEGIPQVLIAQTADHFAMLPDPNPDTPENEALHPARANENPELMTPITFPSGETIAFTPAGLLQLNFGQVLAYMQIKEAGEEYNAQNVEKYLKTPAESVTIWTRDPVTNKGVESQINPSKPVTVSIEGVWDKKNTIVDEMSGYYSNESGVWAYQVGPNGELIVRYWTSKLIAEGNLSDKQTPQGVNLTYNFAMTELIAGIGEPHSPKQSDQSFNLLQRFVTDGKTYDFVVVGPDQMYEIFDSAMLHPFIYTFPNFPSVDPWKTWPLDLMAK